MRWPPGFRPSRDDFDNMKRQFPVYDALYDYCRARVTTAT
jgi:hypothetical protein